jgi:hypothetical protein
MKLVINFRGKNYIVDQEGVALTIFLGSDGAELNLASCIREPDGSFTHKAWIDSVRLVPEIDIVSASIKCS